jgi:hypothetical protein
MDFRITIDIFSGRKNPVLTVTGKQAEALYERLRPASRLSTREASAVAASTLGYRGLIIEASGARGLPKTFRLAGGNLIGPQLSHRAADESVENFIVRESGLLQRVRLGNNFADFLLQEIERFRETCKKWKHRPPHWPHREHCHCAPLYEPAWWNDGGQRQWE